MSVAAKAIDSLRANRLMASQEEAEAYLEALAGLRLHASTTSVRDLFDGLDDGSGDPQATFQLVHLLESYQLADVATAVVDALPAMAGRAASCGEILVARMVNSNVARAELRRAIAASAQSQREAACAILRNLAEDRNTSLAANAMALLDLCSPP